MERTSHGKEKHEDKDCPMSEAAKDKANATEIYIDAETDYYVFVGARGRTHIFTSENLHHTSFRTTQKNRIERLISGK
jgi:hypothetical protein